MKAMTEQNLINAFGGESQANMRYMHFAQQAERDSLPAVSRLFVAIAYAEYVHAGDHFRELRHLKNGVVANSMAAFGPGDTKKNLDLAIAGETYEIDEMYPVYIEVARFQGEKGAQRSFEWSYQTEKEHKRLFEKAREATQKGKDVALEPIRVCETCGYTVEGEAPEFCPLCNAPRDMFRSFE
jgi:rubrerythrin